MGIFVKETLLIGLSLCVALAGPAWPDSAGGRETLALQACLFDSAESEHQCFDIPYYVCIGEQLAAAANPNIARERCLFQELTVWSNLLEEACDELSSVFEQGTSSWDALCFDNNSPNWSYLTQGIDQPEGDRSLSRRLSSESVRSYAIQLRLFLAAYRASQ